MRTPLLTLSCLAAALFASEASASSIENVITGTDNGNHSVATLVCAACPALQPKKRKVSYVVPQVAAGTARVELKEIDGEMKLVRTEAWLGGSPVVFINKASDDVVKAAQAANAPADTTAKATIDVTPSAEAAAQTTVISTVDIAAKTGSLTGDSAGEMAAAIPTDSRSQEFDPQDFKLRLK